MAPQKHTSVLPVAFLGLAAFAGLKALGFAAGSVAAPRRGGLAAPRAAFESGKVNLGADVSVEAEAPPLPVIECDESCMTAIFDCLEDGCSMEALAKLDVQLAEDERKIASSVEELRIAQKTAFSEENTGTLAWLNNFLDRSGSLRAQLHAMSGMKDSDFVTQMIKAASVGFGGGRRGNYPKVGVSPYSA